MRNTWFIDIDGTIVKHKTNEELDDINTMFNENDLFDKKIQSNNDSIGILKEYLLDGVRDFWEKIPKEDIIILTITDGFAAKKISVKIEKNNGYEIKAEVFGEEIDIKKHEFKVEIKSPTFHEMHIEEGDHVTLRYLLDL